MKYSPQRSAADQIANWLVLLRSGKAGARDYAAFTAWRSAHPANEQSWQRYLMSLGGSARTRLSDAYPLAGPPANAHETAAGNDAAPQPSDNTDDIDDIDEPVARKLVMPTRRRLLAGALALGTCGISAAYMGNAFYPLSNVTADAATATGQRRKYKLPDGSHLTLDARSQVNMQFNPTQRKLHLVSGALAINAVPDIYRPLQITTAEGTIRSSLGSRYMVRQQAQRTVVIVHENNVQVQTISGTRQTVPAGTGVRFDSLQIDSPRSELLAEASWESGWIDAQGRPLMDVVGALRPYRAGLLRISMAAGGLPVFGRYSLDDTDATLSALEQQMPIKIRHYGPWAVSIEVRPASQTV